PLVAPTPRLATPSILWTSTPEVWSQSTSMRPRAMRTRESRTLAARCRGCGLEGSGQFRDQRPQPGAARAALDDAADLAVAEAPGGDLARVHVEGTGRVAPRRWPGRSAPGGHGAHRTRLRLTAVTAPGRHTGRLRRLAMQVRLRRATLHARPGRPAWRWAGRRTDPSVGRVAPVIFGYDEALPLFRQPVHVRGEATASAASAWGRGVRPPGSAAPCCARPDPRSRTRGRRCGG
ncbi:MAG: hypothetical protein JWO13_4029, partial [Acidobacteriales bacterium]|nr:hypothetical protein [Terriglobales bacterium]